MVFKFARIFFQEPDRRFYVFKVNIFPVFNGITSDTVYMNSKVNDQYIAQVGIFYPILWKYSLSINC